MFLNIAKEIMKIIWKENIRLQNMLKALLLSLGVLLISIKINGVYYYQPDDFLMNYISRGSFGNGEDSYLVFMNILFGKITAILYKIIPSVNWFGIMYIVAVGFIFWALHYVFLEMEKRYVFLIVIAVLQFGTMLFLTFTVVAYMGMTVFWGYVAYMLISNNKENEKEKVIIAFLLLIIGLGFRNGKNVFLSSLIVYIPMLMLELKKNKVKKMKCYLFLFCLTCVFMWQYNKYAYSSNDFWNEYNEYNLVRSAVLDNPIASYEGKKAQFEALKISENDLNCLKQWIFADKNVYSMETMKQLSDINQLTEKREFNLINIIRKMLQEEYNYFFAVILILFILYSSSKKRTTLATMGIFTYALIVVLFVRNRPVERVMIPIYFSGIVAMMFYGFIEQKDDCAKYKRIIEIVICSTFLIIFGFLNQRIRDLKDAQELAKIKYEDTWQYIQNNKEYLFVGSSSTLNIMLGISDIFNVGEKITLENVMKLGTWDMYSSRYYNQVNQYNLYDEESLLLSMAENENIVYIVAEDHKFQTEYIKTFIEEHSGKKINVELINRFDKSNIEFYRFYSQ